MVKINSASAETITSLPGIGSKLALRIVAHRTRYGFFTDTADLARVDRLSPRIATMAQSNIDWSIPNLASSTAAQTVTPLTFGETPVSSDSPAQQLRSPWLSSGLALLALGIGIWPQLIYLFDNYSLPANTEFITALSWTACLASAVFGCISLNWQQRHNAWSYALFFITACTSCVLVFSLYQVDHIDPLTREIIKLTAIVLLFSILVSAPHFLQKKLHYSLAQTTQFNLYLLAILVIISLLGVQLSYFSGNASLRVWLFLLGGLCCFDGVQSLRQKTPHQRSAVFLSILGSLALINATLV